MVAEARARKERARIDAVGILRKQLLLSGELVTRLDMLPVGRGGVKA